MDIPRKLPLPGDTNAAVQGRVKCLAQAATNTFNSGVKARGMYIQRWWGPGVRAFNERNPSQWNMTI